MTVRGFRRLGRWVAASGVGAATLTLPAVAKVGQFIQSFKEFPPRQKPSQPGSVTLGTEFDGNIYCLVVSTNPASLAKAAKEPGLKQAARR